MKTKTLQEIIREAAIHERDVPIVGKRTWRNWPRCMLCNKEVDAAKMENVSNTGCEVRAWCHGAEDAMRITWTVGAQANANDWKDDPNIDWSMKRAFADTLFFDPGHIINDRA